MHFCSVEGKSEELLPECSVSMKEPQSENDSSLTTDKVKEGSKNGLRSNLRSSNFIGGHAPEVAACLRTQSRIQPNQFDLLPPGLGTHRNNELIIQHLGRS